jgi:hypothetical protein
MDMPIPILKKTPNKPYIGHDLPPNKIPTQLPYLPQLIHIGIKTSPLTSGLSRTPTSSLSLKRTPSHMKNLPSRPNYKLNPEQKNMTLGYYVYIIKQHPLAPHSTQVTCTAFPNHCTYPHHSTRLHHPHR